MMSYLLKSTIADGYYLLAPTITDSEYQEIFDTSHQLIQILGSYQGQAQNHAITDVSVLQMIRQLKGVVEGFGHDLNAGSGAQ
jgi:hypothetical protein